MVPSIAAVFNKLGLANIQDNPIIPDDPDN
jgi:hypothetical protein